MTDAHRRRFDCVVVWKFDRFARSVSHLLRALETFKAQGIEFVSFSEQMDTGTPAGKMVFTVLGAVAELERSLIVERVKAGLRNARAKGKSLGRPKRVVDARRIAELRAQGAGWKKISREMGIGVGTLYRLARGFQNSGNGFLNLSWDSRVATAASLELSRRSRWHARSRRRRNLVLFQPSDFAWWAARGRSGSALCVKFRQSIP
jgi:hypothetical protein